MKGTGKYLMPLLALSLMVIVSGCQLDGDEPLIVKQVEIGVIVAGQTGDRIVSDDFGGVPHHISSASGAAHGWVSDLDRADGVTLGMGFSNSSSASSSYQHLGVGGFGGLQIAGTMVYDSVFRCEDWPADSSTATITIYNKSTNTQCTSGTRSYLYLDSIFKPHMFASGDRIDAEASWGTSSGCFQHQSYNLSTTVSPLGAYIYTTTHFVYRFWEDGLIHYVGFRWWSQDRYRYGYLKVSATTDAAVISAIGYEK